MHEELYRQVLLDYEERRRQNEQTEWHRRQQIERDYPDIQLLLEGREKLLHDAVADILNGRITADDLTERMNALSRKIRQELVRHGLPEDYLQPVYRCPLCRDTGFVGETIRERCACLEKAYQEKLREAVGLKNADGECFEAYDEKLFSDAPLPGSKVSQRQLMEMVRRQCKAWADTYPEAPYLNLVLSGKSGLGKTFLLHCMANRLIERGFHVLLISAYAMLEMARKSYFEQENQMEDLLQADVLLLDDLGSEPLMQNITVEQLFNLLNERMNHRRATVISTNLNLEELKNRYTERIASRLTDRRNCCVLPLAGRDVRNGRV